MHQRLVTMTGQAKVPHNRRYTQLIRTQHQTNDNGNKPMVRFLPGKAGTKFE
ncbi:hypothetical protein [Oceanobacillus locisalsi]|uniref:Uncharacterized protein n=1 Tax=Oceanobacillus locisalsi TaxID=546107 RepID=A0ABW3NDL2_9BACI